MVFIRYSITKIIVISLMAMLLIPYSSFAQDTGRLVVVAEPDSALIQLDNRDMGRGSVLKEVSPGQHQLSVRANGYVPFDTTISIQAASRTRVRASLSRKMGQIEVSTIPEEASIFINGSPAGTGSVTEEVPSGVHTVTAKAKGYSSESKSVNVKGGTNRVQFALSLKGKPLRVYAEPKEVEREGNNTSTDVTGFPNYKATVCRIKKDDWILKVKGEFGEEVVVKDIKMIFYEKPERSSVIQWGLRSGMDTNFDMNTWFGVDGKTIKKDEFPIGIKAARVRGPGHNGFALDLVLKYSLKGIEGYNKKSVMTLICKKDSGFI